LAPHELGERKGEGESMCVYMCIIRFMVWLYMSLAQKIKRALIEVDSE
jgi:hypothetical protein